MLVQTRFAGPCKKQVKTTKENTYECSCWNSSWQPMEASLSPKKENISRIISSVFFFLCGWGGWLMMSAVDDIHLGQGLDALDSLLVEGLERGVEDTTHKTLLIKHSLEHLETLGKVRNEHHDLAHVEQRTVFVQVCLFQGEDVLKVRVLLKVPLQDERQQRALAFVVLQLCHFRETTVFAPHTETNRPRVVASLQGGGGGSGEEGGGRGVPGSSSCPQSVSSQGTAQSACLSISPQQSV